MFFQLVFKGNQFCDFLFASLGDKTFPKMGLLYSTGATCFHLRAELFGKRVGGIWKPCFLWKRFPFPLRERISSPEGQILSKNIPQWGWEKEQQQMFSFILLRYPNMLCYTVIQINSTMNLWWDRWKNEFIKHDKRYEVTDVKLLFNFERVLELSWSICWPVYLHRHTVLKCREKRDLNLCANLKTQISLHSDFLNSLGLIDSTCTCIHAVRSFTHIFSQYISWPQFVK